MPVLTRGAYALPGTSTAFKTGTWRVERPMHVHGAAPCHAACPAGEDAQAYLAQVEEGHFRAAWETLVSANPLPAITGRVCHHPCETACNRGAFDEAIAIHAVERHLGEEAIRHGWDYPVAAVPAGAPRVAVVGGGPAGLAAAYHLVRQGLNVTLFEGAAQVGGTLRTAIPPYRLPREVLDAETERLLATGVVLEAHKALGRDMSLQELQADFRAVFMGPGNQRGREWSVDGVTPQDLQSGLEILQEWVSLGGVPAIRNAVIVGGGNTAVDLARILKRAGVVEVHVVTHQALPGPGVPPEDTMTAIPREIYQAQEEGVQFHPHRGIRRLILRGERVAGVEMIHMKKLADARGDLRRVAFEGTETVLHVDRVIPAIGQEVDEQGMEAVLKGRPFFLVDTWGRTEMPGIYAGGDARGGAGSMSRAVGDGRRAAAAIAREVRGEAQPEGEARPPVVGMERLNLHYYEHAPRPQEAVLPVAERTADAEIERGLSREQVSGEGTRCLSCGNCMACDNCWTLCPDSAVLKTRELASDGSHYVFDYDFCKGCGLCANECPVGYIAMAEDL
jgi:formate dehydrogenase beta subunit